MTRKSANTARTNPPDRDGDGRPGGSLPGNETIDAAKGPAPTERDAGPGDPNRPDDGPPNSDSTPPAAGRTFAIVARLFAREAPASEVEAEVKRRAEAIWGADGFAVETRFGDLVIAREAVRDEPVSTEPLWISEGDDGVDPAVLLEAAQELAIDYWGTAEYDVAIEDGVAVARLHDGAQPWPEPDPSDTFTPEEVAAGRTPVIEQEGEATATAADAAVVIDEADPLVTVDTETAPIAVRLSELNVLISSRRLYKTPEGYSATYSAPYIDAATVERWVRAGLALEIPTAGNIGGVRVTAEARSVATRLRQQQRQAEAA